VSLYDAGMAELTVGVLATRTGLTIRTLHHYDEIGLLSPSARTRSGYRLYSDADVRRLERIVLLRGLGMPLESIASAMQGDGHALIELLERHSRAVDGKIDELRKVQSRLAESIAQLRNHDCRSTDDALALIEAVAAFERYFTDEQRQTLRTRADTVGVDRIRQAEAQWARLIADVRREMDAGTPPADVRVVTLAREWQSLLDEFTNGRFDIARSAGRMMRSEPAAQRRMSGMGLTPQVMDYVAQAMAYVTSG
jgi:MerR family transcriptional regulator, thiopeptide resistance regulator